jgi:hypothetical protein
MAAEIRLREMPLVILRGAFSREKGLGSRTLRVRRFTCNRRIIFAAEQLVCMQSNS